MQKFDSDTDLKKQWEKCICSFKPSCLPNKKHLNAPKRPAYLLPTLLSFISYHNDRPPSSKCLPIPMPSSKKVPPIPCSPTHKQGFSVRWMNEGTNFWKSALHMVCSPHHHMIYWKYRRSVHLSLWPPIKSLWFIRGTGDSVVGVHVGSGSERKIGNQN